MTLWPDAGTTHLERGGEAIVFTLIPHIQAVPLLYGMRLRAFARESLLEGTVFDIVMHYTHNEHSAVAAIQLRAQSSQGCEPGYRDIVPPSAPE